MDAVARRAVRTVLVQEISHGLSRPKADDVAVEEPLEVRLIYVDHGERTQSTLCVTMRTPGADQELVIGYLYAEGVINAMDDVSGFQADDATASDGNVLAIELSGELSVDLRRLQRHVFTSSSCGVCGVPSLDAVTHAACPDLPPPQPFVDADLFYRMPAALFDAQPTFRRTGGLHAAALFDRGGRLIRLREDVGRHNAMDKLVGSCLRDGLHSLGEHIVLVSGRASYELVQKALRAGVPVLAAVGAPSSLAIDLAQAHDLTLLGFVRDGRYNVYHGEARLRRPSMH